MRSPHSREATAADGASPSAQRSTAVAAVGQTQDVERHAMQRSVGNDHELASRLAGRSSATGANSVGPGSRASPLGSPPLSTMATRRRIGPASESALGRRCARVPVLRDDEQRRRRAFGAGDELEQCGAVVRESRGQLGRGDGSCAMRLADGRFLAQPSA